MSTGPVRRAGRTAALVVSVLGTAAQAAAHWAASSHGHADHDAAMLLAHVLAAVLTAAVVARRGAALRPLVRLLQGLLPALPSAPALSAVDVAAARPSAPAYGLVLVGRLLATSRRRRGPPAALPLRPAAA